MLFFRRKRILPIMQSGSKKTFMFDEFLVAINLWMAATFAYAVAGCFP